MSQGLKPERDRVYKNVCGWCTPGRKNKCRYLEVKKVPMACLNNGNGRIRNTLLPRGKNVKEGQRGWNGVVGGGQWEIGQGGNGPDRSL